MLRTVDLNDGKYEIVEDINNGAFKCLKFGEEWKDLTDDDVVISMFDYIKSLEGCLTQIYQEILEGYDSNESQILSWIDDILN